MGKYFKIIINTFKYLKLIPINIWKISLATLCMNISSIIAMTFTPLLLTSNFGVTIVIAGIFESTLDSVSLFIRVFSGFISDKIRCRKKIFLLGYVFSFIARLFFLVIAFSQWWVFAARIFDRIGNGIQASPRDALIAESAKVSVRSICYSLRYCLSILGSILGGIIGHILYNKNINYHLILGVGLVPMIIAIFLLSIISPSEAVSFKAINDKHNYRTFLLQHIHQLTPKYWKLITFTFCFNFGNLSLSFLLFLVKKIGIEESFLPIIVISKTIICMVIAMPIGFISEKIGKYNILIIGFIAAIISNASFCLASSFSGIIISVLFLGLQMVVGQSTFLALIAEEVNAELHGTAFGVFHFISGVAVLITNLIIGLFWNSTFIAFGINSLVLIIGLIILLLTQLKYWLYKANKT